MTIKSIYLKLVERDLEKYFSLKETSKYSAIKHSGDAKSIVHENVLIYGIKSQNLSDVQRARYYRSHRSYPKMVVK